MPISGPILGRQIHDMCFSRFTHEGSQLFAISQAIGNGIINSILASGIYQGVSTGLGLGVGVSVGVQGQKPFPVLVGGIVDAFTVSNFVYLNMLAQGLTGAQSQNMAYAIGDAVSSHMLTAVVQGASSLVARGNGIGSIIGVVGPVMGMAISLQMFASGLTGPANVQLSNAIGMGVATALSATVVNTVITGVPIGPIPPAFPPIPCVGTDIGKLI